MDTIIFAVLVAAAVFAAKGARNTTFITIFVIGLVLTAILFRIHVTDHLDLNF